MKTEFDLRLAYKADTGMLPVRGDESSLRGDLDFGCPFDIEDDEEIDEADFEEEYFDMSLDDPDEDEETITAKSLANKEIEKLGKELIRVRKEQVENKTLLRSQIEIEANAWAEDILMYVAWIEERLLEFENNKPLKRIRRTK